MRTSVSRFFRYKILSWGYINGGEGRRIPLDELNANRQQSTDVCLPLRECMRHATERTRGLY